MAPPSLPLLLRAVAVAVLLCALGPSPCAGASFPLPESQWTNVGDPIDTDTSYEGIAIIGYRNIYPLPALAESEFLSSITVDMVSYGQDQTIACVSVVPVQTNDFDPFAVGEDGVCAPGHVNGTALSNPLNDVDYFLVVEAALDPSVQLPSLRYTQCLTNSECATMYNVTVSYVVCDGQSIGPQCENKVTPLTLGEPALISGNTTQVVVSAVQASNSTLSLSYSVEAVPDGSEVCIAGNFGTPLDAAQAAATAKCSAATGDATPIAIPLPGVGRFYWTVFVAEDQNVAGGAFAVNLTASVTDCTATVCTSPGALTEPNQPAFDVHLSSATTSRFLLNLDDSAYAASATVSGAAPSNTAYSLSLSPYDFQNVPDAVLSLSSAERDAATGVRALAVLPSDGLWVLSLQCSACDNANVTLEFASDSCNANCSGHGECSAGVCDCDEGFAGAECSKLVPLEVGKTSSHAVPATGWVYWVLSTPSSTESVTVAVTDAAGAVALVARKDHPPSLTAFSARSLDSSLQWAAAGGETWVVGVFNGHYGLINSNLNVSVIASVVLTPASYVPDTPDTPATPLEAIKGADTRIKIFNWSALLLSLLVLVLACVLLARWAMRARAEMRDVVEDDDDYLRVYETAFEEDRASRAQDVVFH